MIVSVGVLAFQSSTSFSSLASSGLELSFLPSDPSSEYLPVAENAPDHGFCAKWDPEYGYRGKACCERVPAFRRASAAKCSPQRVKWNFCDEMTEEQREYLELARHGKLGSWWENRSGLQQSRAYCGVNQGFLVHGRPLVPTPENRLLIRNPHRCTQFGTDRMVGALEWLGREIHREYSDSNHSGVRLNVGDLSAPRGGCISGRRGRRGHASHTSGQDADLGFLYPRAGTREVNAFAHDFDVKANVWLLKRLFSNPYACVKLVFVDQRLIRKMSKAAFGDLEWERIRPFIKHIRGHRHHFHVRVGDVPGLPGCPHLPFDPHGDADPGEEDWEGDSPEGGDGQSLMQPGRLEAKAQVGSWSAATLNQERLKTSASSASRAPSQDESTD
ncbi:MAG: hypothetical protein RJB38_1740 [Pseudomonadota bacterium]|jgi:murein endopeptidase